jgi:ubiquinone biosynthesis protein
MTVHADSRQSLHGLDETMNLLTTGKDIRRLNELVSILLKYGFGDVLRRLQLAVPLEKAGRLLKKPHAESRFLRMRPAARLCAALQEMGPTYVKLGQILATRSDLLPEEWIAEFSRLQDSADPLPFSALKPQVEAALGKPLEQVFLSVDETPIGVASMAQVHRAKTRRGDDVVLKIQKPGIGDSIEADLRLLMQLARFVSDNAEEARRYRPVSMVAEFDRSLRRELDFTIEARNAQRIRHNLRSLKWLTIPRVYKEYTSPTLCVQEYVEGISARQIEKLEAAGLDRYVIARRGAKLALKMLLDDGFFHADPHPGNFLALPSNCIAMLDFGMVGSLTEERRTQLVHLLRAIIMQEPAQAASILADWSDGPVLQFDALVADVEDIVSQYYGVALAELDVTAVLLDVTRMVRQHNLVLPADIAMLVKAIVTLEGFGRALDPGFDIMREAEPLIRQLVRKRYSPKRLAKNLGMRALDMVDRIYAPPATLPTSRRGKNALSARHLDKLATRIERSQYRQVHAILITATMISGSLLLAGRVAPAPWGVSLFGLLLLLGSLLSSSWLWWVSRRFLREWE